RRGARALGPASTPAPPGCAIPRIEVCGRGRGGRVRPLPLPRGAGPVGGYGRPAAERGTAMIELAVVRAEREEARTPTLKEADDSMLVARFLAGERRAFTELADRYHVRLMNFIQRTI